MEASTTPVSTATKILYVHFLHIHLPICLTDTRSQVYVGKLGNAYIAKSEIAGQTDFLYGFGTCWITHSSLSLRSCGGGITAVCFHRNTAVGRTDSRTVERNQHDLRQ